MIRDAQVEILMIIAIDGDHGVGKSTIVCKLKKNFENDSEVIFYKFPTYTELGNLARRAVSDHEPDDVLSLLFCADYHSAYSKYVLPNLDKIIILDRYVLTLFVYQGLLKNGDYDYLIHLCKNIPKPNVQIIVSKPVVSASENPFYTVASGLDYFIDSKVYFVENIMNQTHENEEGYIKIKEIIEDAINNKSVGGE